MRKDKKEAFILRKQGKTYGQISEQLGISKSTLSLWFRDFDWSSEIRLENHTFNHSPEKIRRMHEVRRKRLDEHYKSAILEAENEYIQYRKNPIFIAGLMLYLGEGDRSVNNGFVRITNSEFHPVLIFKRFLEQFCPQFCGKIRIWFLLYPDLDDSVCKKWWSEKLGVDENLFSKSQVIQGRHKTKRLLYGVGTLIMSSKYLKTKILRWIELASNDLSV